jgi:hypothetical protein
MRRFLIALTLIVLLAVSIGVGLLVAHAPHWCGSLSTASPDSK